jgi:hypothetical protein
MYEKLLNNVNNQRNVKGWWSGSSGLKHEALSSNPLPSKKKKNQRNAN